MPDNFGYNFKFKGDSFCLLTFCQTKLFQAGLDAEESRRNGPRAANAEDISTIRLLPQLQKMPHGRGLLSVEVLSLDAMTHDCFEGLWERGEGRFWAPCASFRFFLAFRAFHRARSVLWLALREKAFISISERGTNSTPWKIASSGPHLPLVSAPLVGGDNMARLTPHLATSPHHNRRIFNGRHHLREYLLSTEENPQVDWTFSMWMAEIGRCGFLGLLEYVIGNGVWLAMKSAKISTPLMMQAARQPDTQPVQAQRETTCSSLPSGSGHLRPMEWKKKWA